MGLVGSKTLGIGQEILSMLPESIPGTRIDRMGLKSTRRWKFVSDQKYVSGQMHDSHFVIVRIQPFRSIACWPIVFLIAMKVFVLPPGSGWSQTVPRCVQTCVITDLNWHIVTQQKSVFWGEPRFLEPRITFERCRVFLHSDCTQEAEILRILKSDFRNLRSACHTEAENIRIGRKVKMRRTTKIGTQIKFWEVPSFFYTTIILKKLRFQGFYNRPCKTWDRRATVKPKISDTDSGDRQIF